MVGRGLGNLGLLARPPDLGAVGSDAGPYDGDLARDRDPRPPGADPPYPTGARHCQRREPLHHGQHHMGCF